MFLKKKQTRRTGKVRADHKREYDNARGRMLSQYRRDIGPIPAVINQKRRNATRTDFPLFCLTYFRPAFPLPFSPDHLSAARKIERAALYGGLFAWAMPRGGGKTTLAQTAVVWVHVHGHLEFTSIIGPTETHAEAMLANVKTALSTNDLLAEDFPEVCFPIRALENDARRCSGQLVEGKRTNITWTKKKVVLPTIEGSRASASIITTGGITGRLRGQNHTLPDGRIVRPKLALIDDAQTKESAMSDAQCAHRESIVAGDILGMAGPGEKIAALFPCTIIRPGDLSDRMLDRKKHPDWQGEKTKMLKSLPTNQKRWDEYSEIRKESLRQDGDGAEATEFYRQHRAEMDEGAEASWPERKNHDELSAVQHGMNLMIRDEAAFFAEYQNDPKVVTLDTVILTADQVAERVNGHPRGTVPTAAQKLTAFIDVQDNLLFWMVAAFEADEFAGWVTDYNVYPEQPRKYFTLRQADPTLSSIFPGLTKEAFIYQGLKALTTTLLGRQFRRDDGNTLPLDKLLIDIGYEPDTVCNFIRSSGRHGLIMPCRGIGIGAAGRPMSEYQRKPGEQIGSHWMIPSTAGTRELRHVRSDVNHWKTFVRNRLAMPAGTKGGLTLFGSKPAEHRLLGDHLTSEYSVITEGRGRQVEEFRAKPNRDNHLWDCLIGCYVGASMVGCRTAGSAPRRVWKRKYQRVTYAK